MSNKTYFKSAIALHILCILIAFPLSLGAANSKNKVTSKDSLPKLEIRKARFGKHTLNDFERLVIEFSKKDSLEAVPTVKVSPHTSGREATISLENIQLVGAIPEASINDSYVPNSKYIGPVSINTDDPAAGLTLRIFLKKELAAPEAIWLGKPTRLVIDVFPSSSPRSQGLAALKATRTRKLASLPTVAKPIEKMSDEHTKGIDLAKEFALAAGSPENKSEALFPEKKEKIICFPTTSQLTAAVSFHPKALVPSEPEIKGENDKSDNKLDSIVCYPLAAQVIATVGFQTKPEETTKVEAHPTTSQTLLGQPQPVLPGGGFMQQPSQGMNTNPYALPGSGSMNYAGGGMLNLAPGLGLGTAGGVQRAPASGPMPYQGGAQNPWPANPPAALGGPAGMQQQGFNRPNLNPNSLLQQRR